jgi:hypothetical protein
MKKFKVAGITALALIGLVGCSEEVAEKEVTNVTATDKAEEKAPEAPKKEEAAPINQAIVDDETVKATLTSIELVEDPEWDEKRYVVTYEVENKTDLTLVVQAESVSADGKMIDEGLLTMSTEIAPGKKADAVLEIEDYDNPERLPEIKENFEMTLDVFDWDYQIEKKYEVVTEMK